MFDHDNPRDDARTRAEQLVASVEQGDPHQVSPGHRAALVDALTRDLGVAADQRIVNEARLTQIETQSPASL